MKAVNLLPRKDGRERRRQPNFAALGGVAVAVTMTAVLCAWFLNVSGKVGERRSELDSVQAELAATPPPPPQDTRDDGLAAEKTGRLVAVASALNTRVPWDRVLRELSLVTPEDVWLTNLQASAPAVAAASAVPPTAGVGAFAITGRTYSHDAVARLLSRLALVPSLSSVKLEKSTLNKVEGRDLVEFTLAATVRGPEASS